MKVLVVIDMQNDFIDGVLGTKEAVAILPKVREKIAEFREKGYPVIFTRDTHYQNYMQTQEGEFLPVKHCIYGSKGWEITDELEVRDSVIIDKPTFGSLALATYVEETYPGAEVVLIGVCTDICVISNAMILKATAPETKVTVDASCCAGVTPQSHENALKAMEVCQIRVKNQEMESVSD